MASGRTDVERTDDGRFVMVGGRRWRATDPLIPTSAARSCSRC